MTLPKPFKPVKGKFPSLKSWSYTVWSTWKECPLRAKYRWIDRLKEPSNKAMSRGNDIHTAAEKFVQAKSGTKTQVKELKPWAPKLVELRRSGAAVEEPWGFDKQWTVTSWREAWLRMKLDVRVLEGRHARVIDHKTGKRYDSHKDQAELYTVGAFLRHPELLTLDVEMWYIDQKSIDRIEYDRRELPSLVRKWDDRAKELFRDRNFYPRPTTKCAWCSFSKSKGGPCKYG